jgi:hypothetical protein
MRFRYRVSPLLAAVPLTALVHPEKIFCSFQAKSMAQGPTLSIEEDKLR